MILPAGATPDIGTIYTSAPSVGTPYGLVAKVTDVHEKPHSVVADLSTVPITEAAPSIDYNGALELAPVPGASTDIGDAVAATAKRAHAAGACVPPKLLKFHAHLDSVEVRQASLSAWPPQLRLQFAVRTTESMGVAAAAIGINCDWTLGEVGFQGAIPVGPLVVPVYATLPLKAGVHLNGRLEVGAINVASTTVASVASGVRANEATLSEQGSNAWLSGSPGLSGSAKLYTNIGLEAGIGVAKGANVHLKAAFGPEFNWASGQACTLALKFSGLQAGLNVFGKDFNTPGFKPWQRSLWSGCNGAGDGGGGTTNTGGGGTTSGGGGATTGGGGTTTTGGGGVPSGTYAETVGGVTHTWTDYNSAGGTQGASIQTGQSVGIACKLQGFRVADGNTWWYKVASSPWNGAYYASADAFYNNGQTSGGLVGTPWVDPAVPDCAGSPPPPPPPAPTWSETVGGNANTWTNYTNAGGTQGPTIPAYTTVQISCKLQGFRVADGNTWWYRIASGPWNNAYYVSADAFYNNGQTSGSLVGTPFVDTNIANC